MPTYADSMLALIDSRVSAGQTVITKMGTVITRSATTARADVAFDGSSGTGQAVKCAADVLVDAGDRVMLLKVQSDWVIVGNYTMHLLGDEMVNVGWPSSQSGPTSATYIDMPNSPSVTIVKRRADTVFVVTGAISSSSSVSATVALFGANISSLDGVTSYDVTWGRFAYNTTGVHLTQAGFQAGTLDPPGTYTVTARWQRLSGTGTLTVDSNDRLSMRVQEVLQ